MSWRNFITTAKLKHERSVLQLVTTKIEVPLNLQAIVNANATQHSVATRRRRSPLPTDGDAPQERLATS